MVDPIPWKKFAARHMTVARCLASAKAHSGQSVMEFGDEFTHILG